LALGIWRFSKEITRAYSRLFWRGLAVVPVLLIIDALSPLTCQVTESVCAPIRNISFYIHASESALVTVLVLALVFFAARKNSKWWWFFWVQIASTCIGILANFTVDHSLFFLQIADQIIILIWLQQIVFAEHLYHTPLSFDASKHIRRFLTLWLLVNAAATLALALLHVTFSERFDDAIFASDTAWFGQHSLIVGIGFIVLARYIWQGHRRAWQILASLLFIEVIKYSSIEGIASVSAFYMLQFTVITMSGFAFVRRPSNQRLNKRLQLILVPTIAAGILASLSIAFRSTNISAWEHSLFTPLRVVERFFLLEINVSPSEPLAARLFAQLITVLGICFYIWLISSLFLPEKYIKNSDYDTAKEIIMANSTSSEDVFKLWPADKAFWQYNKTVIAYKVVNSTAFVLADPLGATPKKASSEFIDFARSNGWQSVWLMVGAQKINWYQAAGLQTMAIGSSALVNIKEFSEVTIKNKWWRWVRNKNTKAGLRYACLTAPQSAETLQALKGISDEWLTTDGRTERGFALGYFDEQFLKDCTVHALKNENNELVAFANQLPTYNGVTTALIDLMRSNRDYEGSMAYLLSEMILNLYGSTQFTAFDLGFVPFAAENETRPQRILRLALKPVFSAHGLKQFKNKFEPNWQKNYVAWDGDVLDLLSAAKNLATALRVDKLE
jgi:phosphatidylglycerol lysyltransferase